MKKTSRLWFAPLLLAIVWATGTLFIGCHVALYETRLESSKDYRSGPKTHHVYLIEVETPQININTATKAELMTLPGIGEIKARRIIEGRPYQRVADLWKLAGFGEKTMESLRDKITVHEARGGAPKWIQLRPR